MSIHDHLDTVRLPAIIALILGLIYIGELLLAGSFQSGTTYRLVTNLPSNYDPFVRAVSPFLHSNHSHIVSNVIFLLVLSPLVLSKAEQSGYLAIFLISSWFTASIMPWLYGGMGFGISGANAALAGWATVLQGRDYILKSRAGLNMDTAISILFVSIPLTWAVINLGQGFGFVEVKEGVSILGHFSGAIFGLVFGFYDILGPSDEELLELFGLDRFSR